MTLQTAFQLKQMRALSTPSVSFAVAVGITTEVTLSLWSDSATHYVALRWHRGRSAAKRLRETFCPAHLAAKDNKS